MLNDLGLLGPHISGCHHHLLVYHSLSQPWLPPKVSWQVIKNAGAEVLICVSEPKPPRQWKGMVALGTWGMCSTALTSGGPSPPRLGPPDFSAEAQTGARSSEERLGDVARVPWGLSYRSGSP